MRLPILVRRRRRSPEPGRPASV